MAERVEAEFTEPRGFVEVEFGFEINTWLSVLRKPNFEEMLVGCSWVECVRRCIGVFTAIKRRIEKGSGGTRRAVVTFFLKKVAEWIKSGDFERRIIQLVICRINEIVRYKSLIPPFL
jgi:hypothetical protein